MTSITPNPDVVTVDVEQFYQSYADAIMSQDDARAVTHYHDDVVVRVPGRNEFGGEYQGREVVLAVLERLHAAISQRRVRMIGRFIGATSFGLLLEETPAENPAGRAFRRVHVYQIRGDKVGQVDILAGPGSDPEWTSVWL